MLDRVRSILAKSLTRSQPAEHMCKVHEETQLNGCLHMQKPEARSATEAYRNPASGLLDLLGTGRRRTIPGLGGP